MYELIDSTTFKLRRISPNLWQIFELTYQALKTHAINWIEGQCNIPVFFSCPPLTLYKIEMIPTLDNFLSYGSDVFKSRADYRNMIIDIYTTVLNSDSLGENDFINGSKLADSILLNLRGHVDDVSGSVRAPLRGTHNIRSTCKSSSILLWPTLTLRRPTNSAWPTLKS